MPFGILGVAVIFAYSVDLFGFRTESYFVNLEIHGCLGIAIGVALITITSGCNRPDSPLAYAPFFANVTNIVFTEDTGPNTNAWKHFTVSDTNELRLLVSFDQLKTKPACKCGHIHEALFQGPVGNLRVSFCDHCFDLIHGNNVDNYEMPKEFMAGFQKFAQRQPGECWNWKQP